MRDDELLAEVRDQGDYKDQQEAHAVTDAVLTVLAARITSSEAHDLAAQLPSPLDQPLRDTNGAGGESFDLAEFYRRVGERTGRGPHTAERDAAAVLSALPAAVSAGQVRHLVTQLPNDFAALFNRHEDGKLP